MTNAEARHPDPVPVHAKKRRAASGAGRRFALLALVVTLMLAAGSAFFLFTHVQLGAVWFPKNTPTLRLAAWEPGWSAALSEFSALETLDLTQAPYDASEAARLSALLPDGCALLWQSQTPDAVPAADATDTPVAVDADTTGPTPVPDAPETETDPLDAFIASMSMQDKLGQLVMFGFSGVNRPNEQFCSFLEQYHVGNLALYGVNIDPESSGGGFDRAAALLQQLGSLNQTDIPFLVSIDVEGGLVQRFKWRPPILSGRKQGQRNDTAFTYDQFLTAGKKLRETGINMDLAPVLDVAKNPSGTFLKSRIISSDAETVSSLGAAAIQGLNDGGCLSTAKHFPGHGATSEDSHARTPVVNKTLEEMEAYDLIPFRAGIDAGVDVVLVAHIFYPEIDGTDIASMSDYFLTELLRETYGFTGVIMSDDFRMGGLTSRYSVGEAAVKFLLAGGDLILCGKRMDLQKEILEALTAAAEDGSLPEARIDECVRRILEKKMKVTDWSPTLSTP